MPDVAFKDLCIDVTADDGRPEAVARYWSVALGQPVEGLDPDDLRLAPPADGPAQRTVWICTVPEPIAGKTRVHLDLRLPHGDPAPLLAVGGTVEREPGGDIHWFIVRDPDGVAACVFPPSAAHPERFGPFELVVDAAEPLAIATWWAARTGGTVAITEGDPWVTVTGAAGFPYGDWVFNPVPEPKTVKNRVHWDVTLVDATVDDLVAAGATLLRAKDDEIDWWVLADPEGNEFCAFDRA